MPTSTVLSPNMTVLSNQDCLLVQSRSSDGLKAETPSVTDPKSQCGRPSCPGVGSVAVCQSLPALPMLSRPCNAHAPRKQPPPQPCGARRAAHARLCAAGSSAERVTVPAGMPAVDAPRVSKRRGAAETKRSHIVEHARLRKHLGMWEIEKPGGPCTHVTGISSTGYRVMETIQPVKIARNKNPSNQFLWMVITAGERLCAITF